MDRSTILGRLIRLEKSRVHSPALAVVTTPEGEEITLPIPEAYKLWPEKRWMWTRLRGGPVTEDQKNILIQWMSEYVEYMGECETPIERENDI